ncbi:hypothetical protein Pint_03687 [Pistacia integerrima]|uniref:Uncharacterized protein n=1 Tax=Pistacia integerrima TaxID=434235 RepID=A0ACC0Z2Y5_9ROSI|nr:hypothetical protein Pint_03687 [Pistacia integerrima]
MKQKIVIKVQMSCEKCRSKAMKIAAMADGVSKVEMQGAESDQLVVIGEGVDAVKLTRSLRKKLRYATLESVQEEKDDKQMEKPKENKPMEPPIQWSPISYYQQIPSHQFIVCEEKSK